MARRLWQAVATRRNRIVSAARDKARMRCRRHRRPCGVRIRAVLHTVAQHLQPAPGRNCGTTIHLRQAGAGRAGQPSRQHRLIPVAAHQARRPTSVARACTARYWPPPPALQANDRPTGLHHPCRLSQRQPPRKSTILPVPAPKNAPADACGAGLHNSCRGEQLRRGKAS
jgi:hypothetical protein